LNRIGFIFILLSFVPEDLSASGHINGHRHSGFVLRMWKITSAHDAEISLVTFLALGTFNLFGVLRPTDLADIQFQGFHAVTSFCFPHCSK